MSAREKQLIINIQLSQVHFYHFNQSLYKSNRMSVSEFFRLFPNSSETTKPDELKFWEITSLGMLNVLGLKTSVFVEPLAGK